MKLSFRHPRLIAAALALCTAACGGTARPAADPGPERSAEVGETLTFDGSESRGDIDTYLWDFGDGSPPGSGKVVEHAFSEAGDYSVALSVRGPGGASTAAAVVHVGQGCLPQPTLDVLTATPKPAEPVQLSAGNSVPCEGRALVRYAWDFGDGTTEEGPASSFVTHTWAEKGTYALALEVEDVRGAVGRATRTLNVGVIAAKPVVQCPATASATVGKSASFSATASDPAGQGIAALEWTFSDGGTATGGTVSHTFATAGMQSASITARTNDDRLSDPCTIQINVTAPPDWSGNWLVNPSAPTGLTGCMKFAVGFPATHLLIDHQDSTLTATPSGTNWPAGTVLTGMQEPPPAPANSFRIRVTAPQKDYTASGCGPVTPEHSVELVFNPPDTATGKWTVVHDFACVPTTACPANCNCVAQGTFSAKKQ